MDRLSGRVARASMLLFAIILNLVRLSNAQTGLNCPLPGPVYPPATNVLTESASIPQAIRTLNDTLNAAIQDGTLTATNVSFQINIFSADESLFDFSYTSPTIQNATTSGPLDANTVFRTGSIGKFLTVYTLLAATGVDHLNDPVTKWIPELATAPFENDVSSVRWEDVTIKALASHMAGIRDCTQYSVMVVLFELIPLKFPSVILPPFIILQPLRNGAFHLYHQVQSQIAD